MRVVSLVPSATEIVIALGAGDQLVAVSDDCRAVRGAENLPVVSRAVVGADRSPLEVDAEVRANLASGSHLYALDSGLLSSLAPDIVFAEDDCAVCAVPSSAIRAVLGEELTGGRIISTDPKDLAGVFDSFEVTARALGLGAAGTALVSDCRHQLGRIEKSSDPARVIVLDWTEPAFVAGNWVPELVVAAGGIPVAAVAREPSHPIALENLISPESLGDLDAVVVAPCGLELAAAKEAALQLLEKWPGLATTRLCAFDGRSFFSRPGPGLVEGTLALAGWLAGEPLPPRIGVDLTGSS